MKKILLRGSWQTKNIGDIAHTPGFLNLAARFMPETEVRLWPCAIDLGVREMLLANFPGLRIAETDDDIKGIQSWREQTGKPYGFFGISADFRPWTDARKELFSAASFIFCRDSLSVHFLRQQQLDCPVVDFGPDSTFGLELEKTDASDFLRQNDLEPGRFICVIPRLRFTPTSFDEEHFYYSDPKKEAASMQALEPDMEKLREVIVHIVRRHDLKVLICPEMTYQVPMGRRFLYEKLPADVREKVVLKREYWITSEAESVYAQAAALVSMEMHSPIIFIVEHKPALLLRQAEDTWKGQMWRDLDMQDWILELNVSSADLINRHLDRILLDHPAAVKQAEAAAERAVAAAGLAMEQIKRILNA